MALLDKLKSLLGLGDSSSDRGRRDTDVTVERDRREEASTESEDAVKGAGEADESGAAEVGDAAADEETDAAASTGSMVDEEAEGPEAAEQGEAVSPDRGVEEPEDADAGGPDAAEVEDAAAADEEADAAASTGSMVDEGAEGPEAAEVGEAAGPESEEMDTDVEERDDVETADTGEAEGEDVQNVKGIGSAYAERLGEIGIDTVDELADADAADVAERTTVSEKRVQRWIDRANER